MDRNRVEGKSESVCADLRDWCSWACETGNMPLAEKLDRLRMVFREKPLSLAMSIDAVILVVREEVPFEQIFGALFGKPRYLGIMEIFDLPVQRGEWIS